MNINFQILNLPPVFFFFKLTDLLEAAALKAGEAAGRLTDDIF